MWILCLIFLPFATALVYLIVRGRGMADRQMRDATEMKKQQDAYIRDVAAQASPADQIAQAQKMLDAGVDLPARVRPAQGEGARLTAGVTTTCRCAGCPRCRP